MANMRQPPIHDPRGHPSAQLTTLAYDYADGHAVPAHVHPEDQMVFAFTGVMTVETPQGTWIVPPQRAVWIPGGEIHAITMFGIVRMRSLYFAPGLVTRMGRGCGVLTVSPLLRELIIHACGRPAWHRDQAEEDRLIGVLIDQLGVSEWEPVLLSQPRDPRAQRLAARMLREPKETAPLDDLCRRAGASKRTLERIFQEETGMTLGRWRQQCRLLHAMRLLAAGEKVGAAAAGSGYRSVNAFIVAFKTVLGETPGAYFTRRAPSSESQP